MKNLVKPASGNSLQKECKHPQIAWIIRIYKKQEAISKINEEINQSLAYISRGPSHIIINHFC